MALSHDFEDGTLGTWTAFTPAGTAIAVVDGWAQITVPSGTSYDSIFATSGVHNAPSIYHALPAGAWFVAMQVSDDIGDMRSWGWNLCVCDVDGEDQSGGGWVRYGFSRPNDNTERPNRGAWSRPAGSGTGSGGTTHYNANVNNLVPSLQSGIPAWIGLAFDGVQTFTPYYSTDGVTWRADAAVTRAIVPTRVYCALTSTSPSTAGVLRIAQTVLGPSGASPPGDLRGPIPGVTRTTVSSFLGTAGVLPAGWADDSTGGDSATWTGSALRLASDAALVGSRARIRWTGTKYRSCGLLVKAQFPTYNGNLFATLSLVDDQGAGDVYVRDGGGYGMERGNAALRPIEIDSTLAQPGVSVAASNVSSTAGNTGLDEKRYGWLDDQGAPVALVTGAPTRWFRIERLCFSATPGGRAWFRVKEWADGASEPASWLWEGRNDIERQSLAPAIVLAHNNPAGGLTGTAQMDLQSVELYEIAEGATIPAVPRAFDGEIVRAPGVAVAVPVPRVFEGDVARASSMARAIPVPRAREGDLLREPGGAVPPQLPRRSVAVRRRRPRVVMLRRGQAVTAIRIRPGVDVDT